MKQQVLKKIDDLYEEMVELRRDFHMYPELSFEEKRTAQIVADYQRKLGLEVRENVGNGYGIVATLKGGKPGKTVAIRADFDALPIVEQNDVPYKSKNEGVMHACGHDAHTAVALGMSKAFVEVKDELEGNIVFIHQNSEEKDPGGAKSMVEDGALEGVDIIFATHMENYLPVDHIYYSHQYILGASDDFEITIKGFGGHAAFPHDCVDVIGIGAQLVSSIQQIMSRKVDPLKSGVVTIGSIHSGEKTNVIPEDLKIEGTVRTFDKDARQEIHDWLQSITKHTCEGFGAESEVVYHWGYPATLNDPEATEQLIQSAKDVLPEENILEMEPNMGAEDFSYFLEKIPGTYFFTGTANEEKGFIYPYHHPKWDIDERSLANGAKVMAAATIDYLKK
ncbi:amidohydrolase [Halalkalibacillus sediminis]|uniref:Amidohydrolase n=1 Tax=Halalkalibacillus sediminis TaxID=2018042 RepID=A0A2I0QTG9_9BACI|nr:amidohydrolase [Halalkalibacillus sediminis]PKR77645.1 amidohydrolase [Halalkalibacillus sediminis]